MIMLTLTGDTILILNVKRNHIFIVLDIDNNLLAQFLGTKNLQMNHLSPAPAPLEARREDLKSMLPSLDTQQVQTRMKRSR